MRVCRNNASFPWMLPFIMRRNNSATPIAVATKVTFLQERLLAVARAHARAILSFLSSASKDYETARRQTETSRISHTGLIVASRNFILRPLRAFQVAKISRVFSRATSSARVYTRFPPSPIAPQRRSNVDISANLPVISRNIRHNRNSVASNKGVLLSFGKSLKVSEPAHYTFSLGVLNIYLQKFTATGLNASLALCELLSIPNSP